MARGTNRDTRAPSHQRLQQFAPTDTQQLIPLRDLTTAALASHRNPSSTHSWQGAALPGPHPATRLMEGLCGLSLQVLSTLGSACPQMGQASVREKLRTEVSQRPQLWPWGHADPSSAISSVSSHPRAPLSSSVQWAGPQYFTSRASLTSSVSSSEHRAQHLAGDQLMSLLSWITNSAFHSFTLSTQAYVPGSWGYG